jgi:hypothetical protein
MDAIAAKKTLTARARTRPAVAAAAKSFDASTISSPYADSLSYDCVESQCIQGLRLGLLRVHLHDSRYVDWGYDWMTYPVPEAVNFPLLAHACKYAICSETVCV